MQAADLLDRFDVSIVNTGLKVRRAQVEDRYSIKKLCLVLLIVLDRRLETNQSVFKRQTPLHALNLIEHSCAIIGLGDYFRRWRRLDSLLHDLNILLKFNHVADVCMIGVDLKFLLDLHLLFFLRLFAEETPKEASAGRFLRLNYLYFLVDSFLRRQFPEGVQHVTALEARPVERGPGARLASPRFQQCFDVRSILRLKAFLMLK